MFHQILCSFLERTLKAGQSNISNQLSSTNLPPPQKKNTTNKQKTTLPAADTPPATTRDKIIHTTTAAKSKVAITENQKTCKPPRRVLLMGKRAAIKRAITRTKGTKCK